MYVLERELKDLRRNITELKEAARGAEFLEFNIVQEMRVRTKTSISSAMFRTPKKLIARDGGPEYDGVLQAGSITWSYPCSMHRFRAFCKYMNSLFRPGAGRGTDEHVLKTKTNFHFTPSYIKLMDRTGFLEAEVTFERAADFFRMLGIERTEDIMRLLWVPFDEDDEYVRVVGGTQIISDGTCRSIRLFIGHSCNEQAVEHDVMKPYSMVKSFLYNNAEWDGENNCFSGEPIYISQSSGFCEDSVGSPTSVRINWEVDRNCSNSRISHVSMHNEGVRQGKMCVHIPTFSCGPQVTTQLGNIFSDGQLLDIVKSI